MKKLATVAAAVVMTAVSGLSFAGDLSDSMRAEMLAKTINGYKWSQEVTTSKKLNYDEVSFESSNGFKWAAQTRHQDTGVQNTASSTPKTAATATSQGFKWGIRSTAEQQGFKWGIRSTAEQQGFKWGIR